MYQFDDIVRGSFELARKLVLEKKSPQMTEIHFLLGLINNPASISSQYLQSEKNLLEGIIENDTHLDNIDLENIKPSKKFQEWITLASSNAIESKRKSIQEYDFLKYFQKIFPNIKLNLDNADIQQTSTEVPYFLINLNQLAEKGKLDPVIGRAEEILQIQKILCRRTKNNPVLVGLPGVGKTAIVEGLAGLIQTGKVPDIIKNKIVYSLDVGSLMTGTKFRGEFEEKLKNMIQFFKNQAGKSILFIDEIHLLIGTGKADGALDAANLLKPSLARGEINCVGSTTLIEYKKYIETDPALERRFHKILVEEPSKEDTIQIILGLKEKLEIHHGIEITDEAVIFAVQYAIQYITERFLPDKAIDLIDEAAAGLKLNADSMPPEMERMKDYIRSKKILNKSQPSKILEQEIKNLERIFKEKEQKWQEQNIRLKEVAQYKKKLDEFSFQLQKAEQEGNLDLAAKIRHGEIPQIKKKLDSLEISWKLEKKHIAKVTSRITGIPIKNILRTNNENIKNLLNYLQKRIIGQENALVEITNFLLTSYVGLSDPRKPLGSFLLLGPSGIGKTETAKAVAQYLFYSEKNLVRIDLSEYSEPHSVSKLIGSPPGYIGYEKGGLLTEAIRKKNYSAILFDEIDKAHPNFSDILLQILDEGKLTDTQGNIANFQNTIIFITSNLKNPASYLKPEVIGRIDHILHYKNLNHEDIRTLVIKELGQLNQKIKDKKLQIELENKLQDKIITEGFNDNYGARPLKSTFSKYVTVPIAKKIIQGTLAEGAYQLNLVKNHIKFIPLQHTKDT